MRLERLRAQGWAGTVAEYHAQLKRRLEAREDEQQRIAKRAEESGE